MLLILNIIGQILVKFLFTVHDTSLILSLIFKYVWRRQAKEFTIVKELDSIRPRGCRMVKKQRHPLITQTPTPYLGPSLALFFYGIHGRKNDSELANENSKHIFSVMVHCWGWFVSKGEETDKMDFQRNCSWVAESKWGGNYQTTEVHKISDCCIEPPGPSHWC